MDLKIKDVAELLNISESTVRRWLIEGKIPAYRLNKQYRFSRSEIEDWLLQQKLDVNFSESSPETEKAASNLQFSLYRAIYRGSVHEGMKGSSKEQIFRNTMQSMATRFNLDSSVLTDLFLDREKMMPTTLGHGIGMPHTRDFLLDTHYDVIEVVYPEKPIPYGALDGEPVHILFFLFASEDRHHLNLVAKLANLCNQEKAREFFKTKPSKERLLDYVKQWESALSG